MEALFESVADLGLTLLVDRDRESKPSGEASMGPLESELRALNLQKKSGLISAEEYERERAQLLKAVD